jgi:Integrase core domain
MATKVFLKYNNYDYSPDKIREVVAFKETGDYPAKVKTPHQRAKFAEKWKDFVLRRDKLFLHADLEVVPSTAIQDVLKQNYADPTMGVGVGIRGFYEKLCAKYVGIRRADVGNFQKQQKVYQMTRPLNHVINKPLYESEPNAKWCIDTMDLNPMFNAEDAQGRLVNRGYRYILNCIDVNSRFLWSVPLKLKSSIDIRNALETIVRQAHNTYPKILQSDHGTEFRGVVEAWKEEHGILTANSRTYTPQSNGLVENINQQMWKMLREFMVRNKSNNWVDFVDEAAAGLNNRRNGTIKARPVDVWRPGHLTKDEAKHADNLPQSVNLRKAAAKAIARNPTPDYHVGDWVRVKMTALYTKERQEVKAGNKKTIVVRYSPQVYVVSKCLRHNQKYEKQRYNVVPLSEVRELRNEETVRNRHKTREPARFFGIDFMLVKKNQEAGPTQMSLDEARRLNQTFSPSPDQVLTEENESLERQKQENRELDAYLIRKTKRERERDKQALKERKQLAVSQAKEQLARTGVVREGYMSRSGRQAKAVQEEDLGFKNQRSARRGAPTKVPTKKPPKKVKATAPAPPPAKSYSPDKLYAPRTSRRGRGFLPQYMFSHEFFDLGLGDSFL